MESIFFIIASTSMISALLWYGFKEDYQKDKLEFQVTVIGVFFAVLTFVTVGKVDMFLGLILAVFIIFLRKHFWEDYKTKRDEE